MDTIDRIVTSLYALAIEEEWDQFRRVALERAARGLGATAAAWLTQPGDQQHPAEFTGWPGEGAATQQLVQSLTLKDDEPLALAAALSPPGTRHGAALRFQHLDSRLVSRVAFWFPAGTKVVSDEALARLVPHLVESGALALKHFILADERLSRWGRSNRGTAAMVDGRGNVHAASKGFRELMAGEFGASALERLPFALPDDVTGEHASFSQGALRLRAVRTDDLRFLVYARKAQPLDGLSPREQEIARALSTGKTFKSVARQCGIATSTVANHASRIYRKLGIYRREELFELVRTAGGARERVMPGAAA